MVDDTANRSLLKGSANIPRSQLVGGTIKVQINLIAANGDQLIYTTEGETSVSIEATVEGGSGSAGSSNSVYNLINWVDESKLQMNGFKTNLPKCHKNLKGQSTDILTPIAISEAKGFIGSYHINGSGPYNIDGDGKNKLLSFFKGNEVESTSKTDKLVTFGLMDVPLTDAQNYTYMISCTVGIK